MTSYNKLVRISLSVRHFGKDKEAAAATVENIIRTCKGVFPDGIKVLESGVSGCELLLSSGAFDNDYTEKIILGIAKDILGDVEVSKVVKVSVSDLVIDKKEKGASPEALMEIERLVGCEEFKELAREITSIAPQIIKSSTQKVFANQSYLFSINSGCGLSTHISLFAELINELSVFSFSDEPYIVEETLRQRGVAEAPDAYLGKLAALRKERHRRGGQLYCIDISEWIGRTDDKDFREMLSLVAENNENNIFIFRIPFIEGNVLREVQDSLSDMLFIREVSFTPYDMPQLEECAERSFSRLGFTMDNDAWEIFETRIAEEKSDGRFYGINTVNKVVNEIIYHKLVSNAKQGSEDTSICKQDIISLAATYGHRDKTASQLLSELVGMDDIKEKVHEIVNQIKVSLQNDIDSPCLHMQFIGNPGTGKTTVARIVGKLLKENGVLRNGDFFEYSGRDFCGKFIGETAPKTASMCRDAYGSVLFIDEAYSLYRGDSDSRDFGREALDTLIAQMENHRTEFVVIMAGYADEMETLMSGNIGLKSRMPYTISFSNYTSSELFEIFKKLLTETFKYDDKVLNEAKCYFESIPESVRASKEFSNARFVRNLFERTWSKAAMRSKLLGESEFIVTAEDFKLATTEREFSSAVAKKTRSLGFR